MYIGKKEILYDSISVSEKYKTVALEDEKAAEILVKQKLYNQAAYFYIQAMEKQIKGVIAERIDLTNCYFAQEVSKTMGHSLEASVKFLIQILPLQDEFARQQVEQQMVKQVLNDINFRGLHNTIRYPIYSFKCKNYSYLKIGKEETDDLQAILDRLKKYLTELRIR